MSFEHNTSGTIISPPVVLWQRDETGRRFILLCQWQCLPDDAKNDLFIRVVEHLAWQLPSHWLVKAWWSALQGSLQQEISCRADTHTSKIHTRVTDWYTWFELQHQNKEIHERVSRRNCTVNNAGVPPWNKSCLGKQWVSQQALCNSLGDMTTVVKHQIACANPSNDSESCPYQ